jgi:hypothetical protein
LFGSYHPGGGARVPIDDFWKILGVEIDLGINCPAEELDQECPMVSSKRPRRRSRAPVKASFSCLNSLGIGSILRRE